MVLDEVDFYILLRSTFKQWWKTSAQFFFLHIFLFVALFNSYQKYGVLTGSEYLDYKKIPPT